MKDLTKDKQHLLDLFDIFNYCKRKKLLLKILIMTQVLCDLHYNLIIMN